MITNAKKTESLLKSIVEILPLKKGIEVKARPFRGQEILLVSKKLRDIPEGLFYYEVQRGLGFFRNVPAVIKKEVESDGDFLCSIVSEDPLFTEKANYISIPKQEQNLFC